MRLFRYFARSYPWATALMLGCLLLAAVAEGVGISTLLPLLGLLTSGASANDAEANPLQRVVRTVLDHIGLEPGLTNLLLIMVGATVIQSGLSLLAKRQVGYTVARVTTDLRTSILRGLSAARWSYFTKQPAGEIANSMASETLRAGQGFLASATIVSLSVQAALYSILALAISWQFTIGTVAVAGFVMYSVSYFVKMAWRAGEKQTILMRSLLGRLTDTLQALKPLKAMSRESVMGALLEQDNRRLNRALERQVLGKEALKAIQAPLTVGFAALGIAVAITVWEMPVAELGVLALLFGNILSKLTKAQREYQTVSINESALWALTEMIDGARSHREALGGSRVPSLRRGIQFEHVGLRYDGRAILEEVSLQIPAGRITAIVGASGAGKTSVADLVCGLVRPGSGAILVDGVPLEQIDLRAWRQMIGYVSQETLLLNDSIRANVTLGEDFGDAEVETALRQAGAWDYISELPDGIDSPVGERGSRLSGGQSQRIAIARALVHGPSLLILDEATSALDPTTEARVWESIAQLRGAKTILAISHQAALLAVADCTYRMDGGTLRPVDTEHVEPAKRTTDKNEVPLPKGG